MPAPPHAAEQTVASPTLRVTILGSADDPRVATMRKALGRWNASAARLGLRVRFDSGTLISHPLPEDALRATRRAMPGRALGVLWLRNAPSDVPGDVVIALSRAEFISFGVTTGTRRAFASDRAHFSPLTTADEQALRKRWRLFPR